MSSPVIFTLHSVCTGAAGSRCGCLFDVRVHLVGILLTGIILLGLSGYQLNCLIYIRLAIGFGPQNGGIAVFAVSDDPGRHRCPSCLSAFSGNSLAEIGVALFRD